MLPQLNPRVEGFQGGFTKHERDSLKSSVDIESGRRSQSVASRKFSPKAGGASLKGKENEGKMNEIDAQLQGKIWTKYADIPESLRAMHAMLLITSSPVGNKIYQSLKNTPGVLEQSCEYWFNNSIEDAIKTVKS